MFCMLWFGAALGTSALKSSTLTTAPLAKSKTQYLILFINHKFVSDGVLQEH